MVAFLCDATADYNGDDKKRLVYPYHLGLSSCLGVVADALDVIDTWIDLDQHE